MTKPRKLPKIVAEIKKDWKEVDPYAVQYMDIMGEVSDINEMFGADCVKDVVLYFLCNASKWQGEVARRIKNELRAMCA